MKTVTELIEIAEETFRSEDRRLENERFEAEQRRKDEWNGRVKDLQNKVVVEKHLHKSRKEEADKLQSSIVSFFILVAGYILLGPAIISLLWKQWLKWWEVVIWPLFIPVDLLTLVLSFFSHGSVNSPYGSLLAVLLIGVLVCIDYLIVGSWLAVREEDRRHTERLQEIRVEGEWLKLSSQTVEELQEELERARIQ